MSLMQTSLCWLFAISCFSVSAHIGCGSDQHTHNIVQNMNSKPKTHKHSLLEGRAQDPDDSGTYEKIRISWDTSLLESHLNSAGYDRTSYWIDDVIPAAYQWLQNVISVRPVDGPLTFALSSSQYQCGSDADVIIDEDMFDPQGSGMPNTDVMIYFTSDPTVPSNRCTNVMGFAGPCHANARNRPIAGYVNFCLETILSAQVLTWEESVAFVIHESFHVLGFISEAFDRFVYENDTLRTDVYKIMEKRGATRKVITLPTVVQKAQEFFDCDTMDGIELENLFAVDKSSHWDARIAMNDVMISYIPNAAVYSTFTLALLEDSGWYNIDWKYAQETPHGRRFGCEWYDSKCIIDGQSIDDDVFCGEQNYNGFQCGAAHLGDSACTELATYADPIPSAFQYFGDPYTGSKKAVADYCPVLEVVVGSDVGGDCRLFGRNNAGAFPVDPEALGGIVSGTSKCAQIYGDHNGNGVLCVPTECFRNAKGEYAGTRLTHYRNYKLTLFDVVTCWSDENGESKALKYIYEKGQSFGFDEIFCPEFAQICYNSNPYICNGHGTIYGGECVCSAGYIGSDCSVENTLEKREFGIDSDDVYVSLVCNEGVFGHSDSDDNIGILDIEIAGMSDTDSVFFANAAIAIQNWIAILTDISQCEVDLRDYNYDSGLLTVSVYYYSSYTVWEDVSNEDVEQVFYKLFESKHTFSISETKKSKGYHEDNVDLAISFLCGYYYYYVCGMILIAYLL